MNHLAAHPEAVSLRYTDNYFFDITLGEPARGDTWRMWRDVDYSLVMMVDDIESKLY